jgi:hypothetical protein
MYRRKVSSKMPYSTTVSEKRPNIENNVQYYYQKGYANGYKRHKEHMDSEKNADVSYIYNVLIILLIFVILIVGIVLTYKAGAGSESNYKNDCLLRLTTIYEPGHCLDK